MQQQLSSSIPIFLSKLFAIAQENSEPDIIKFDTTGLILQISSLDKLISHVLPIYFGHKNLPSFLRQMNMYGFHKKKQGNITEFKHKYFRRDGKSLLQNIKRRNELDQVPEAHMQQEVYNLQSKTDEISEMTKKIIQQNMCLFTQAQLQQKQICENSQINVIKFKILTDQVACIAHKQQNTQLLAAIQQNQEQALKGLDLILNLNSLQQNILIQGAGPRVAMKQPINDVLNLCFFSLGWGQGALIEDHFFLILQEKKILCVQNIFNKDNRTCQVSISSIPHCPVLRPSAEEFENFSVYIEKIEEQYSGQYGMVKVVPPKGFQVRSLDYSRSLDNLVITGPIEQNVYGKGGNYECLHIQKKSMLLKDYRHKQSETDRQLSQKTIDQLESLFWKSLAFSPPLYGADIKMSLMDVPSQWNLNDIQSVLNIGLASKIPGVNEPYIYVGSWKSFFAWHKEDMDLYSTNYLHLGKDKFWYSIPEEDSHLLEKYAKSVFADHFNKCSEYLRHKTTVINPYFLKEKCPQIRISKMNQSEGEFMFLFGGAYHQGFNCGFNIAEAVNYATINWLPMLQKAKPCRCLGDNVQIDQGHFGDNLKKSKLKDDYRVKQFCEDIKKTKVALRKPIRKMKQK